MREGDVISFCSKSLALTFIAALLTTSSAVAADPRLVDRLEASVNSTPILWSELKRFRKTLPLRAQLDPLFAGSAVAEKGSKASDDPLFAGSAVAEKGSKASDDEITQALIQDRLILSAFPVSDAEVEQEVQSIQASNRIDRQKLKGALEQQGFSFEDYFELIRVSTAKRNLIDRDIRTKVTVSDEDVRRHYASQVSKGSPQAKSYHAKVIVLSRKNYRSEAALQETAARAAAALKSGDTFEEVVARYSDDSSRESNGDLGTLTDDQLSTEIRSALSGLAPGATSGVVGDPKKRLLILRLVSVSEADDPRFLKMKEEIRNQLAASEYQHQIQLWLARQERLAFVHRSPSLGK